METNNINLERAVSKGCPQGSCLRPGMSNIYYNSLLKLKFTSSTKIIAFDDDLLLLTRGEAVSEIDSNANLESTKMSNWARKNKFRFNEKKSKTMLMTRRKRKERGEVEVYLNNKLLQQIQTMKYLGIRIDKKLTFREHITQASEKCRKLIFTLVRSAKLNWGLSHKALKTLYTGGIQPLILYGTQVWAERVEKARYRKILTGVQRLINIKRAKAYRTVSIETLCIMTGIKPIHIKIKKRRNSTK